MKKYIITWDCGFGKNHEVVEAESFEDASREAHDAWQEEVASNSEYYAEEWTEEAAYDKGLLSEKEILEYEKKLDEEE